MAAMWRPSAAGSLQLPSAALLNRSNKFLHVLQPQNWVLCEEELGTSQYYLLSFFLKAHKIIIINTQRCVLEIEEPAGNDTHKMSYVTFCYNPTVNIDI